MNNYEYRRQKLGRAFTLIELLVVIAIIAILAAILFPVFAQAKESAKKASCISNLKQMALACLLYSADYDDVMPPVNNGALAENVWFGKFVGGVYEPNQALIYPYTKSAPLNGCP